MLDTKEEAIRALMARDKTTYEEAQLEYEDVWNDCLTMIESGETFDEVTDFFSSMLGLEPDYMPLS